MHFSRTPLASHRDSASGGVSASCRTPQASRRACVLYRVVALIVLLPTIWQRRTEIPRGVSTQVSAGIM
jgi:hypothetical protein